MQTEQKTALLAAYDLVSDKQREMILELTQQCANKQKDEPTVHIVLGYSKPKS